MIEDLTEIDPAASSPATASPAPRCCGCSGVGACPYRQVANALTAVLAQAKFIEMSVARDGDRPDLLGAAQHIAGSARRVWQSVGQGGLSDHCRAA